MKLYTINFLMQYILSTGIILLISINNQCNIVIKAYLMRVVGVQIEGSLAVYPCVLCRDQCLHPSPETLHLILTIQTGLGRRGSNYGRG